MTPQTQTLDSHDSTKASYVWHYKQHATELMHYISNQKSEKN